MEENKGYPKFQYSVFLRDNRDEQLVIRTETFEELLEAKKDIDRIITKREAEKPQMFNKQGPTQSVDEFEKTCNLCGGPKILNPKTGKWFCKSKCWLQNK